MKNYIIAVLVTALLVMGSFVYKISNRNFYFSFPLNSSDAAKSTPIFYVYVFFSEHNCKSCLDVIQVLNELPPEVKVIGIIPEKEIKEESKIRQMVGTAFELEGNAKYKNFEPLYSPAIIGISKNGKLFFVLPLTSEIKNCLFNYIMEFVSKINS